MNALETLFWRAENYPGMRSNMVGAFVLDRCPDWDRFVARHEWGTRIVPRLRHRVLEPPLRLGRPFWVPDQTFDVRNHVHRVRLPTPGTTRHLLDLVRAVASRPLAPERPLWEATLVEGLDDGHGGKAAYLLKLHHSLSDGVGAAQLVSVLLGESPASAAEPALPPAHTRRAAPATALLAGRLGRLLLALPPAATRAARNARAARIKVPSAKRVVDRVVSFARTTLVPPVPASPLLRGRSHAVHLDALDFPRRAFRAAGQAGDGTLNDVFVAGLMGGFDRYHRRFGVDLPELPLLIPISVRKRDDLPAGNRLASTRLAMPVSGPDPLRRIAEAGRRIATVRTKPTLRALDLLTRPVTPLPGPLVRFVFTQMFRGNDLIATNFTGPPGPLCLAGSRVLGILPFPPLLRGATSIALTTYGDRCHIGITVDTGAFTDPDAFVASLRESFEELFALTPRSRVTPLTA
ncbi:wax ester/triacylglycerol synthase domain-containing protein [Actinosynnema sp. NPDC050436]|uniref:wax ester/triacylglycerol synthase domain-containing protein n=1 Tax=Actinosynnema sp. NPDC050436 TaxID=3155659 RepID=UPI0034095D56